MSSTGKSLPLVFGKVGGDENDFPKIYERNINVKVIDEGNGKYKVRASLFDLEHSFHGELLVDAASWDHRRRDGSDVAAALSDVLSARSGECQQAERSGHRSGDQSQDHRAWWAAARDACTWSSCFRRRLDLRRRC